MDLGCGTGELSRALMTTLGARRATGVDSSSDMLAKSGTWSGDGLSFLNLDIQQAADTLDPVDLVFSNAALHWLPDHQTLWPRVARLVRPGGQIAVQIPASHDMVPHLLANEVARDFRRNDPFYKEHHVLAPETYDGILRDIGFSQRHVRMVIYGHTLPGIEGVVEWLKGSLLTAYQAALGDEFPAFVHEYSERLRAQMPRAEQRPFHWQYKRILMWGRRD